IGKIKIGKKNEKGFPVSLDHFIADGKYAQLFHDVYGNKPNKIQIIFLSDDLKEVCYERYELRTKQGDLFGDGDGEIFRIWNKDKKRYDYFTLNEHKDLLTRAEKAADSPKGWEIILTIRFMIPAIKGVFGQWQLSTKGRASSINAIRDTFDFVQGKATTVTRIPFDLTVQKVKSQKPDDPSLYPVIDLVPNISDENLAIVSRFIESGVNLKQIPVITNELLEKEKLNLLAEASEVTQESTGSEVKLPFDEKYK